MAIKALYNPPDILPEHESMQDYIDMIDNEGLLNNNAKSKNLDSSNSGDGSDTEVIEIKKVKSGGSPATSSS